MKAPRPAKPKPGLPSGALERAVGAAKAAYDRALESPNHGSPPLVVGCSSPLPGSE